MNRYPPLEGPTPKHPPGRYCLTTCYCGECPHYQPLPPVRPAKATPKRNTQMRTERNQTPVRKGN